MLVSYFDRRFHNAYAPVDSMRRLALRVFRHFDDARAAGRFGAREVASRSPDRWRELCATAAEVARELPGQRARVGRAPASLAQSHACREPRR